MQHLIEQDVLAGLQHQMQDAMPQGTASRLVIPVMVTMLYTLWHACQQRHVTKLSSTVRIMLLSCHEKLSCFAAKRHIILCCR